MSTITVTIKPNEPVRVYEDENFYRSEEGWWFEIESAPLQGPFDTEHEARIAQVEDSHFIKYGLSGRVCESPRYEDYQPSVVNVFRGSQGGGKINSIAGEAR